MPNPNTADLPAGQAGFRLLSDAEIAQYRADGFLLVEGLFAPAELEPVMAEIAGKVDRLARELQAQDRLENLHEDADFYRRLTLIERDCPGASVMLHVAGQLEPALAALWSHPRLLTIVSQLIGPDIAGHPVWNLRSKTPLNPLATVPWHQDTAYLAEGVHTTLQPAAWIPFLNAGSEEGTLQFVRGGNEHGVLPHRLQREDGPKNSWYLQINDDDLPPGEIVTVPVPFGSVLLLDQLVPHRSTENFSDQIRWSVDLRWQNPSLPTGMDVVAPPVRMADSDGFVDIDWSDYFGHRRDENLDSFKVDDPDQAAAGISGPWMERWAKE